MSDDYPLSWEEKQLRKISTATTRVEYQLQGLVVPRDAPEENATWEPWGTFADLKDPFAQDRLGFLKDRKKAALEDGPQAYMRILDYRVLRREVITTEWEEIDP